MFESIFSDVTNTLTVESGLICIAAALIFGIIIAIIHMKTSSYSRNFIITLAVLPTLVSLVIMMVNGSLGTSIAVFGAFNLVRFRSMQGTSREITSIFFTMAIGLAVGMGHITFATTMVIILGAAILLLNKFKFGALSANQKRLKITIPEDLDYEDVFEDILDKFTKERTLDGVKTTNMGSMYELTYSVVLNDPSKTKEFIDALRVRNGNLKIILSRQMEESSL